VASVSNGTKNQGNQESGVRDIMINQNVVPQAPASTTTAPSLQPGE